MRLVGWLSAAPVGARTVVGMDDAAALDDPLVTACELAGPVTLGAMDLQALDGFHQGQLLRPHAELVVSFLGLDAGDDQDVAVAQLARLALRWLVPLSLLPALAEHATFIQAVPLIENPVYATVINGAPAADRALPPLVGEPDVRLVIAAFKLALGGENPALAGPPGTLGSVVGQVVEVTHRSSDGQTVPVAGRLVGASANMLVLRSREAAGTYEIRALNRRRIDAVTVHPSP